jgi:hypothetical protein
MIWSIARNNSLIIEKEDLQKAIQVLDSVEKDFAQVFKQVGSSGEGDLTSRIREFIRSRGAATRIQVYSQFAGQGGYTIIDNALKSLAEGGIIAAMKFGDAVGYKTMESKVEKENKLGDVG